VITYNGESIKPRVYNALPCLVPDTMFGIYNNSVDAAACAVAERLLNLNVGGVLTPPILPEPGIFSHPLMRRFSNDVSYYSRHYAHVFSHHEVVEMYSGQKFKLYKNALDTFQREGCLPKFADLKVFIKFEKVNVTKAPRIISPRSPVYNLCLARFLKKLEKIVYRGIHRQFKSVSHHTVYKGLNVIETASDIKVKWDSFNNPCAIGGDITKLDMHIRSEALNYEHGMYNKIIVSRTLKRLLAMQHKPLRKCWFPDGQLEIVDDPSTPGVSGRRATRASGDINTSMGNVILVCAMLYAFRQEYKLHYELVNNGDDFVIITEAVNVEAICKQLPIWFTRFGFVLTMEEPVYEFEQLEFCQTNPVCVQGEWRMCRHPTTVLSKDTICTIPINGPMVFAKWLDAVGQCGLALAYGMPILQSFYNMYVRNGVKCGDKMKQHIFRNTGVMERTGGLSARTARVTQDTRVSFYRAFGVLPDMQVAIENYLDSVSVSNEPHTILPDTLIRECYLVYNTIFYEVSR
jgi:hypothetical protein